MKIQNCSLIGPAWAEISGQNDLADLATNLDLYSVGYRGYKSCEIGKLEQFVFRLTGPNGDPEGQKLFLSNLFDKVMCYSFLRLCTFLNTRK